MIRRQESKKATEEQKTILKIAIELAAIKLVKGNKEKEIEILTKIRNILDDYFSKV